MALPTNEIKPDFVTGGFQSILYPPDQQIERQAPLAREAPDFWADLHLDKIIDSIVEGKEEYALRPLFYMPLHDTRTIAYRQQVLRDLEKPALFHRLIAFSRDMRTVRQTLPTADGRYYRYQRERLFLDAAAVYCKAIAFLAEDLPSFSFQSPGLVAFQSYMAAYRRSDRFVALHTETDSLLEDLRAVVYCVSIKDLRVQVRPYQGEPDYLPIVERLFSKFDRPSPKDQYRDLVAQPAMNHVDAQILEGVATLFPALFQKMDAFCRRYADFIDKTIAAFDREIQFYLAWLEYIEKIKAAGLPFCYPEVTSANKAICSKDSYDLALAMKLIEGRRAVVSNDFIMEGKERIFVITGPNQGGKTTFARTFGQLHYLAALGLPVPGTHARLFLFDQLYTHFEKEENARNLRSKLEDDLLRIRDILGKATDASIVIMNESLSSATLQDAIALSKKVIEQIARTDLLCVWVTFIEEIIPMSDKIVSMVATVEPDSPAKRTFRVVRKKADGLAYAYSLAEKYHVTYDWLKQRL